MRVLLLKGRKQGATKGGAFGYDKGFRFPLCLVNLFVMKPLRQQNRQVISYVPRVFNVPEAAQRWATQMRQEGEIDG